MLSSDFESLVTDILAVLRQQVGFDLWMLTRTHGKDWIVLKSEDHSYGVPEQCAFDWEDSLCAQMFSGKGPSIAPDVDKVEAYASAPIRSQLTIGAYAGVPIFSEAGDFFGTLCAIHPTPLPESIRDSLPLIATIGKVLGVMIDRQVETDACARRTEKSEALSRRDHLTGLFNRYAWETFLVEEEKRCVRLGYSACVIVITLTDLASICAVNGYSAVNVYVCNAASTIQDGLFSTLESCVARTGEDEFSVLCVGSRSDGSPNYGQEIAARIERKLDCHQINARVGIAVREMILGLEKAWEYAGEMASSGQRLSRACRPADAGRTIYSAPSYDGAVEAAYISPA